MKDKQTGKTCNIEQRVRTYYEAVDQGDLDRALSDFHTKAVYRRCERRFVGKKRIERFYKRERCLRGRHRIELVLSDKQVVITKGTFYGLNFEQSTVAVPFVDVFRFNEQGLIYQRETYLAAGFPTIQ